MAGHWTYQGTGAELYDIDGMWEYIREHENYFDEYDFEEWLDDNYDASDLLCKVREYNGRADVMRIDLEDEFEQDVWRDGVDTPEEGADFDYNGYVFTWVEDEDEEDE